MSNLSSADLAESNRLLASLDSDVFETIHAHDAHRATLQAAIGRASQLNTSPEVLHSNLSEKAQKVAASFGEVFSALHGIDDDEIPTKPAVASLWLEDEKLRMQAITRRIGTRPAGNRPIGQYHDRVNYATSPNPNNPRQATILMTRYHRAVANRDLDYLVEYLSRPEVSERGEANPAPPFAHVDPHAMLADPEAFKSVSGLFVDAAVYIGGLFKHFPLRRRPR